MSDVRDLDTIRTEYVAALIARRAELNVELARFEELREERRRVDATLRSLGIAPGATDPDPQLTHTCPWPDCLATFATRQGLRMHNTRKHLDDIPPLTRDEHMHRNGDVAEREVDHDGVSMHVNDDGSLSLADAGEGMVWAFVCTEDDCGEHFADRLAIRDHTERLHGRAPRRTERTHRRVPKED